MNIPQSAKPLSLNDLPKYSNWPKRILGEVDWTVPDRDLVKINQEYEHDKYGTLFDFVQETGVSDPWSVKKRQNSSRDWQFLDKVEEEEMVCISKRGDLYTAPIHDAQLANDNNVVERFHDILTGTETIIELGSGYGYNLNLLNEEFPDCQYIGGEFSENAIKIAEELYEEDHNISVEKFNYYNDDWPILKREYDSEIVLFTRLSIEQLPICNEVISTLLKYLPKIREVIHLEPVYELYDSDSLLDLLRKKYIEINDYNRDLLSVLIDNERIKIKSTEWDIYGFNGLNPMSEIRWSPR